MATTDLKKGDKVYWKKNAGVFIHTLSGTVKEIDLKKYEATVEVNTQHIYGRLDKVHISKLNKNKKQQL
jgi:transcription antitermination factor NusG